MTLQAKHEKAVTNVAGTLVGIHTEIASSLNAPLTLLQWACTLLIKY